MRFSAGASEQLGGVQHRQPERHQGGGDGGEIVHRDQDPAPVGVDGRDDGGGQVADAEPVDLPLDPGPLEGGGVQGVEAGVQFQRRGLEQAAFQQAPRQFQKLALGLVFVDVDQREVLPHDQPVDDRVQHGGFADAGPAGQQQMAALAGLPRHALDEVVPPDQAGDVFHAYPSGRRGSFPLR